MLSLRDGQCCVRSDPIQSVTHSGMSGNMLCIVSTCVRSQDVRGVLEGGVRACSGETFFGLKPRRAAGEFGSTSLPVPLSVQVGSDDGTRRTGCCPADDKDNHSKRDENVDDLSHVDLEDEE